MTLCVWPWCASVCVDLRRFVCRDTVEEQIYKANQDARTAAADTRRAATARAAEASASRDSDGHDSAAMVTNVQVPALSCVRFFQALWAFVDFRVTLRGLSLCLHRR